MIYPDMYAKQTRLDDTLRRFGAAMVGFCSVSDIELDVCKRYPVGIAIAIDLDRDAVADLVYDDRRYYKATQTARDRLYRIYGMSCQLLRSWGHGYMPLADYPLEETLPDMRVDVPLHQLAARAGLGWIGKSGMLITSRYGPRVRLGGILTDAPFERSKLAPGFTEGRCGECRACIEACPVKAIRGGPGHHRHPDDGESLVDARLCNGWRREALATLGRKSECGLCVTVCPVGVESTPDLSLVKAKARRRPDFTAGDREDSLAPSSPNMHSDWVVAPSALELTAEELAFLMQDDDLLEADADEAADDATAFDELDDHDFVVSDIIDDMEDSPDELANGGSSYGTAAEATPEALAPTKSYGEQISGFPIPSEVSEPTGAGTGATPSSSYSSDSPLTESPASVGLCDSTPEAAAPEAASPQAPPPEVEVAESASPQAPPPEVEVVESASPQAPPPEVEVVESASPEAATAAGGPDVAETVARAAADAEPATSQSLTGRSQWNSRRRPLPTGSDKPPDAQAPRHSPPRADANSVVWPDVRPAAKPSLTPDTKAEATPDVKPEGKSVEALPPRPANRRRRAPATKPVKPQVETEAPAAASAPTPQPPAARQGPRPPAAKQASAALVSTAPEPKEANRTVAVPGSAPVPSVSASTPAQEGQPQGQGAAAVAPKKRPSRPRRRPQRPRVSEAGSGPGGSAPAGSPSSGPPGGGAD